VDHPGPGRDRPRLLPGPGGLELGRPPGRLPVHLGLLTEGHLHELALEATIEAVTEAATTVIRITFGTTATSDVHDHDDS
jgi:hypothetical protein